MGSPQQKVIRSRRTERRFLHFVKIATKSRMNMYSSGILRNTSSSPCPNAPQNKARPARTARREKPHTMGSMTPPPPPLFPAPQAFSPRQRYFEKCQPTPCSRRQHRQAGPHKRIGFLARGNQGRYSSIVPGHWTYLYGVLALSLIHISEPTRP